MIAASTTRHSSDVALRFRPEVDLATGRIVAAKALGGASAIGQAVAAAARLGEIDPGIRVWCNVSRAEIGDLARRAGLERGLRGLGVEIAEDAAMRDVPGTLRAFAALRDAGLAIALDDFGAGHCSLAQLGRFRVDLVKLDRTFAAGPPGDVRDREIVAAIVRIGRALGFETVAKGIDTIRQAAALHDAGCRYGQGHYLGRPVAVDELIGLAEGRPLVAV
jgi:EAL domain-containing protein (putative c-di-GMP-specific phosphodiesterase class I)